MRETPSSHRFTGVSSVRASFCRAQSRSGRPKTLAFGIVSSPMPGARSGSGGPAITCTS
jgi:hypothetical protein